MSTGVLSLARSLNRSALPRPVAFTAEASFWMYLVHHPLVGLTQLAMLQSFIPPLAKFALSLSVGIGLSLASYAVLVRGTWIGQLLNGRGLSRRQIQPPAEVPAETGIRRAA
jgi:peptidoglycan/LPS O-acetylase OafA/YrhL